MEGKAKQNTVKPTAVRNNTTRYVVEKEPRKRFVFLIKIILLGALVVLSETQKEWFDSTTLFSRSLRALLIFLEANVLISLTRILTVYYYMNKNGLSETKNNNFILGINRIASVINAIFGIAAVLIFFKVDPLGLLASISIFAAALAILSKDYISNMINGLIIMFSDQLSLNDHIKVGDHKGKIIDVTLINVIILNEDDDIVYIPNTTILNSNILNHSKQNIKKLNFEFELEPKKITSIEAIEVVFKEILKPFSSNILDNSFSLKVMEVKKDYVKFKLQFLLPKADQKDEKKIKRLINANIISLASEKGSS